MGFTATWMHLLQSYLKPSTYWVVYLYFCASLEHVKLRSKLLLEGVDKSCQQFAYYITRGSLDSDTPLILWFVHHIEGFLFYPLSDKILYMMNRHTTKVENQLVSTIPCPATSRTMNASWVATAPSGRWSRSFSAFLPFPVRPSMSRCKNLPEILIKMWFLFLIRFDYILWGRSFLRKPSFMSKSCVSKKVYCMPLIINSRQVYGLSWL